jgi:hypothetical protein
VASKSLEKLLKILWENLENEYVVCGVFLSVFPLRLGGSPPLL